MSLHTDKKMAIISVSSTVMLPAVSKIFKRKRYHNTHYIMLVSSESLPLEMPLSDGGVST